MDDLVLLHGALGASRQFSRLEKLLSDNYNVQLINFEGHGGVPTDEDFSIELFSKNLQTILELKKLSHAKIFGYSMGGYVALHLASTGYPIGKIMTLGTKFNWTPEGALAETKMLNPDIILEKVPKFAQYQEELHAPLDWKEVMRKTSDMMLRLGESPLLTEKTFQKINQNVLCCIGSKDNMVTLDETENTANLLPNGSFHVFKDVEHPIEKIDLAQLVDKINQYFKH